MQKSLSVVVGIGATVASSFGQAVTRTTTDLKQIGSEMDRLNAKKRRLLYQDKQGVGGIVGATQRQAELASIDRHIRALRMRQHTVQTLRDRINHGRGLAKGALGTIGMVAGVATAVVAKPLRDAAEMETAMLGVAKQLDGARDASGKFTPKFEAMKTKIQELARVTPMATTELAGMTAAGLRMGVAEDAVLDFVATTAKMGVAFELPAEELADQMGKIANVYKLPISSIEELGDTINYLDDNAISKGGDIINVLQRIGGTASMLKMPVKDAAALGSTFLSLGSKADVAATASNALMSILSTAKAGGKKVTGTLALLGFEDMDQFQKDMANDATGTILRVLDAINTLPEEKRLEVATMLFGREYADDIAKLAGNTGEYRRQLKLANSEAARGSMQREFEAQRGSAAAQWTETKNRLFELSVAIGDALLPAAKVVMGVIGTIATALTTVAKWARESAGGFVAFATGAAGFLVVGQAAIGIFGALTWAWNAFKLSFFASPIGLAIAAVVGMLALVYYKWDEISAGLSTIWDDVVEHVGGGIASMIEDQDSYYNRAIGGISWLYDEAVASATEWIEWMANIPEKVAGFFSAAGDTVREIFGALTDWLTGKSSAVGDALLAPIKSAVEAIRAVIDGIFGKIADVLGLSKDTRELIGNTAGKAFDAVKTGAGRVFDSGRNIAAAVGDTLSGAWDWLVGAPEKQDAAPAAPAPALPQAAMRGAITQTDNSTQNINIQIQQRPGEIDQNLARRVLEMMRAEQARDARGRMFDAAGA